MKLDRVIAVRNAKTIYRDGENCIKVFDADYSKADILNEALNQARVEETGLNIPKISDRLRLYQGQDACADHGGRPRQPRQVSRAVCGFAD